MTKSSIAVIDVSPEAVDTSRTDQVYWNELLKSIGLGMNRGTTQNLTDGELEQIKFEEYCKAVKAENSQPSRAGRPRKRKKRSIPIRWTETHWATRSFYGFHVCGAKPHAWGRNRLNGQKNGRKDGGAHGTLVYIGDTNDLAALEKQQMGDESGRVTPSGHGPTTD
jgi:hypothetical protein